MDHRKPTLLINIMVINTSFYTGLFLSDEGSILLCQFSKHFELSKSIKLFVKPALYVVYFGAGHINLPPQTFLI